MVSHRIEFTRRRERSVLHVTVAASAFACSPSGSAPHDPPEVNAGGGDGAGTGGVAGSDGDGSAASSGSDGGGGGDARGPAEAKPWTFPPEAPLVEQRPPWRAGSCVAWTQVPPAYDYTGPAFSSEGLWVLGGEVFAPSYLMHLTAHGWTMTTLGSDVSPGNVALGADWIAVATRNEKKVPYRHSGIWYNISSPTITDGPAIVHNAGGTLAMAALDGTVYLYDPSTGWRSIRTETGKYSIPHGLWGEPNNLFEFAPDGLRRWDGSRWIELVSESVNGIAGVGAEVFVTTDDALSLLSGNTLVQQPDVDCGAGAAPSSYAGIAGGAGTLALAARCPAGTAGETVDRVFLRVDGAWIATPELPFEANEYFGPRLSVDPSGVVHASLALGKVVRLDPARWTSLEQSPAPPWRKLAGRTGADLHAVGAGVARLAADGVTWTVIPGSEAIRGDSAWQAPDGTLFVASLQQGEASVFRHDGAVWTRDLSRPVTSVSNIVGRSSSDVYIALDNRLEHWDGAAWSTVSDASQCRGVDPFWRYIDHIALAGPRVVVAHCHEWTVLDFWKCVGPPHTEWDGNRWSSPLINSIGADFLAQLGPPEAPHACVFDKSYATSYHVRDGVGWRQGNFPVMASLGGFAGTPERLVATTYDWHPDAPGSPYRMSFSWLDAGTWKQEYSLALFTSDMPSAAKWVPTPWSDGRWAATSVNLGPGYAPADAKNVLVACDLGP